MSKKKAPKDAFHGLAGNFFAQKKKVVFGNVKHSGNEKDISLKSGSSISMFSDVESLSGDDEDMGMSVDDGDSLLGSAMNIPKAKHVNSGADFGFPFDSLNYIMDKKVKSLPSSLVLASLEKKKNNWVDPVVVKTRVNAPVKKSFALDINFSAMEDKSAIAKTQYIRKIFSKINGFGGITTLLKFEGIIRSTFTSEKSMKKAVLLAGKNGINVNSDLKKQKIRSDQAIMIKEIPMNTPKDMIVTAVAEFGEIKSIKIQLIGLWQKAVVEFTDSNQAAQLASRWSFLIGKDSVHVAMAMEDHKTWASRDQFRALLFILPMGTTAHDLGTLLDRAGFIVLYSFKKPASGFDCFQLAKLYTKKKVLISCPAVFGDKLWAQVLSLDFSSGGSPYGFGLLSGGPPLSLSSSGSQVNGLAFPFCASLLAVSVPSAPVMDSDMALDDMLALPTSPF
ncbi:hypothetical protein G9A89_008146 [Geosiphon pyriformis]|nr:hypothetical protein G9A89_008146 [Geosiphon pyriformis]